MKTPIHPMAKLIPPMTDSQFSELKEDIKQHGQRDAITIFEGMVLDGRHRERACEELGIEPLYEDFPGGDPEAFVISRNLKRRHLTSEQQRVLADVRRKKVSEMRQQGMSTRAIAEKLDVDPKTIRDDLSKQGGDLSPPELEGTDSTPKTWPCHHCGGEHPIGENPCHKVTGRDGKQYPAARPKPAPKRSAKPDPKLLQSIRQKLIGDMQRIRNECEKHGWNDTNELLKQAQNSLKG